MNLSRSFFICLSLIVLTISACSQKTPNGESETGENANTGKTVTEQTEPKLAESKPKSTSSSQNASVDNFATGSTSDGNQSEKVDVGKPESREQMADKKLKEINAAFAQAASRFNEAVEKLDSDSAKQELFERENPAIEYSKQLIGLVKEFPETGSAFTAGMTIVLEYPGQPEFPAAMDLVLEHHGGKVEWHQLASGFLELVPTLQIENWMRKMITAASNAEIKVKMTYLLYRYFDQFPTFASTLEYNPQIKSRFSKEKIDYIYNRKSQVREELLKSLRALEKEHPEVAADGNRKVKDVITGPIFELENLQVGQVAPDIEGTDFDGAEFRLSDYRGKVVMLDFWGQWCPPCRAMFPHERELIEQLVGKPFVLIGVNSDRRLETAIKATRDENLVWRNFWCGPKGRVGPIAKKWNVSAWPTVYLIDADGVIRYKEVLGREIDKGIESLLSEMGHSVKLVTDSKNSNSFQVANPFDSSAVDRLLVQQQK